MSVSKFKLRHCALFMAMMGIAVFASAQDDVSSAGGTSADGTVSFTFGQVACDYGVSERGRQGEGVQQVPCQHGQFVEALHGCDSLLWHGRYYSVSFDTVINTYDAYGCDSIVHLSLAIHATARSEFSDQASESYLWGDTLITRSGLYTRSFGGDDGCDSVVTLRLSLMVGLPLPTISAYNAQTVFLDHYPNGEDGGRVSYLAYRWLRDGVAIGGATSDNYSERRGGAYSTLTGCYTLEVPTDSTMLFWVQSNTICMDMLGIDPVAGLELSLYPNPSAAFEPVTVSIDGAADLGECHFAVLDVYGRVVSHLEHIGSRFSFQAPATAGAYSCLLYSPQGAVALRKLIVR